MKLYPVFKKSNAMKLKEMGFPLEDASSNPKNPNFVIYYFEDTEEFREAFSKLS